MKFHLTSKLSDNIGYDEIGQLVATNVVLAREGEQQYYEHEVFDNGSYKIITVKRPWEVVKASAKSFEGKPFIYLHTDAHLDITLDNIKDFKKGHVQNVTEGKEMFEGKEVRVIKGDIVVDDKEIAEKIRKKEMRDVSCGYYFEIDPETLELTEIRGEHVALVPSGRAGISKIIDNKEIIKKGDKVHIRFNISDRDEVILGKALDGNFVIKEQVEGYPFFRLEGSNHLLDITRDEFTLLNKVSDHAMNEVLLIANDLTGYPGLALIKVEESDYPEFVVARAGHPDTFPKFVKGESAKFWARGHYFPAYNMTEEEAYDKALQEFKKQAKDIGKMRLFDHRLFTNNNDDMSWILIKADEVKVGNIISLPRSTRRYQVTDITENMNVLEFNVLQPESSREEVLIIEKDNEVDLLIHSKTKEPIEL